MDSRSTEVSIIEEIPTTELYLLDDSQSHTEPIAIGTLQICRIQVSGTFFLFLAPDFRYVLSKTIQVLRAKDKRYILPTNQSGLLYGLVVRDPVKAKVEILDVVLEDQTEFIVHKNTFGDSVSTAVAKGGSWIAKGIKRGAALAAVGLMKGKEKVGKMMDERKERKKLAARAEIEAKSGQASQQLPLSSVASMMAMSRAVASTDVAFPPVPPPSAPLRNSASTVSSAVSDAVTSVSGSVKGIADRVVQQELGLSGGTQDLMKGLRLLNTVAGTVSRYVDPATVLRVATSAAQLVAPPRPPN